jgi:GT2 family glycosyltransferase
MGIFYTMKNMILLAERVRKAGYKIYYQPNSCILHKESISTGRNSPLKPIE